MHSVSRNICSLSNSSWQRLHKRTSRYVKFSMHPHRIHTLLAQKPCQILSFLHELSNKFTGRDFTFLFALSANFDQQHDLERVVDTLRTLRCDRGKGKARMVGCLSGPVSSIELPGGIRERLSCAVAVFDSRQCVPFYSDLQGRRETQVGRWHSFRRNAQDTEDSILDVLEARDGRSVNWEDVWNNRSSSNKDVLPGELRSIPYAKFTANFLFFTHRPT